MKKHIYILYIVLFISIGCSKTEYEISVFLIEKKDRNSNSGQMFEYKISKKGEYCKLHYRTIHEGEYEFLYNQRIYKNRYIINGFQSIFDLKTNRTIFENKKYGFIKEHLGDTLVFKKILLYPEQIMRLKRKGEKTKPTALYSLFDLNSTSLSEISDSFPYSKRGEISPNKESIVYFDVEEIYGKYPDTLNTDMISIDRTLKGNLYLDNRKGEKRKIFSNLEISVDNHSSFILEEYPIKWLNDTSFLFQIENGLIGLSNLDGNTINFPRIINPKLNLQFPSFSTDPHGNILYYCETENSYAHIVDLDSISISPIGKFYIPNKFFKIKIDDQEDEITIIYTDSILYETKDYQLTTNENYVALISRPNSTADLKYLDVWNSKGKITFSKEINSNSYLVAIKESNNYGVEQ